MGKIWNNIYEELDEQLPGGLRIWKEYQQTTKLSTTFTTTLSYLEKAEKLEATKSQGVRENVWLWIHDWNGNLWVLNYKEKIRAKGAKYITNWEALKFIISIS